MREFVIAGWRVARLIVALLCTLLGARAVQGQADDRYRFGAGQHSRVSLDAQAGGHALRWDVADRASWDTALLGLRVRALGPVPRVTLSAGALRIVQYLDPGAGGLRWLNLSSLRAELAAGSVLQLVPEQLAIVEPGAELVLFRNDLPAHGRVLVLAPHPDDAEIAAFGFYASHAARTSIVTLTAGNAGFANYQASFGADVDGQALFKGSLRAIDSVTVPWQGGVPPARCFNLGYFDARLAEMYAQPDTDVPEAVRPNIDVNVYRAANLSRLLPPTATRGNRWRNLVADLSALLHTLRPVLIVAPHPELDAHTDHAFTTVALVEALRRYSAPVRALLYTNHVAADQYPYGPAGSVMSLPPWGSRELSVPSVVSWPVPPALVRRKMFALEAMHDLRPAPERAAGETAELSDYLRRAPRSEEIFYVYDRLSLRQLVQSFLASRGNDPRH